MPSSCDSYTGSGIIFFLSTYTSTQAPANRHAQIIDTAKPAQKPLG